MLRNPKKLKPGKIVANLLWKAMGKKGCFANDYDCCCGCGGDGVNDN
jgi:hypothetical protein